MLFVLRRIRSSRRDVPDDSDGALIERVQQGDLDAFNLLVDRYQRPVYNVALRYLRSPEQAEDVTQDAFLRAFRALDTFRNVDGYGFRAWRKQLEADMGLAPATAPAPALPAAADAPPVPQFEIRRLYEPIFTMERLQHWIGLLRAAPLAALDTETDSLDPMRARIVGISFAVTPGEAAYYLIDVGLSPIGVSIPPINGEFWLPTFFNLYFLGGIDGTGRHSVNLTIPNEMALIGTRVFFQSLTAGAELNWTNVCDAVIAAY